MYDTAGVFAAATKTAAEETIAGIEQRTGAQVAVYTQVVDYGVTKEDAERDAIALMNQWGVGRRGFDDGLVILSTSTQAGSTGRCSSTQGPDTVRRS
ncbi:MAG TPA: TPM domain-containing protein [Candidatus Limnocylindrales bacterium]